MRHARASASLILRVAREMTKLVKDRRSQRELLKDGDHHLSR